jgi:SAM-dependent methyltransferase
MGGTVFLEVPDFDACVRRILALDDDARTEIFYRHIFGSQFTAGEYHRNGLTPRRLTRLLEQYGFEVTLAYTQWTFRSPNPLHMNYPFNEPLPDLTVVAKKIGEPSARSNQLWTHESYRERYPNTELHNVSTPGGTHPDEVASYLLRCESSVKNCLQQFIAKLPRDVTLRVITATQAILDRVDASVEILEHDAGGTRLATTLTQMASASADAMCLVGAIQYAVDPMEALRLAVRALRPGGKLYLIPALPSFNNNQARPFFSGLSMEWFTAAFKAVGLHLDEAQGVGGPFDELLSDIAAAVEQLDAAGRQSHPLTAYLRQGRHYPYANWLSHGGHLLDAIPNQNIFCVAGCKVSASGGGDH